MDVGSIICIEVPVRCPSVNHYKKPVILRTRNGTQRSFALTPEALAFRDAVAIFARGKTLSPTGATARSKVRYAVACTVFLGEGERGDADNFGKCVLDSLQHAGVIHSDARVRLWHIEVEDGERENPRTLIAVWVTGKHKTLAEIQRDAAKAAR